MWIHANKLLLTALLTLACMASYAAEDMSNEAPDSMDRDVSGIVADSLPRCPTSPNCVSTMANDSKHRVEPFRAGRNRDEAMEAIIGDLERRKRVTWRQVGENVIKAEFRTALFRFTDDVMFVVMDDGLVHIRSASRIGYSDLGANRKRVEDLREKLDRRR